MRSVPLRARREPPLVLLLPRTLEQFILRDQAEDLLEHARVVAVEPARVPYGALGRLPATLRDRLAAGQARRLKLPPASRARSRSSTRSSIRSRGRSSAATRAASCGTGAGTATSSALDAGAARSRAAARSCTPLAARALGADLRRLRRAGAARGRGRPRRDAGAARGRLVPGAAPDGVTVSPSRSGISGSAWTGRCCARWARGWATRWCCC